MVGRFKPDPTDFIIIIMGPTGSGKTNFINNLTGNAEKTKAGGLSSATQNVTPYPILYNGHRLVLVDTPGFDDTYRSDNEILRIIADWLTSKYSNGNSLNIAGIVYLHRITDNRMSGSVYKNLRMFGRLCGNVPLHRACLVTTMWDMATLRSGTSVADKRYQELIDDFWRPLIAEGAIPTKFGNSPSSACEIIDDLISRAVSREDLLLQEEITKQQKYLNETEAAKVLYSRLQSLLAEQRNTLKELADEAKTQNDPTLTKSLQEECEKINATLQKTFEEMQTMKIPLSRRILLWFFGRKARAKAVKFDEAFT